MDLDAHLNLLKTDLDKFVSTEEFVILKYNNITGDTMEDTFTTYYFGHPVEVVTIYKPNWQELFKKGIDPILMQCEIWDN